MYGSYQRCAQVRGHRGALQYATYYLAPAAIAEDNTLVYADKLDASTRAVYEDRHLVMVPSVLRRISYGLPALEGEPAGAPPLLAINSIGALGIERGRLHRGCAIRVGAPPDHQSTKQTLPMAVACSKLAYKRGVQVLTAATEPGTEKTMDHW